MMTGQHPNDLELLDYVEDELTRERRRAVGAHVESCATCEATVGDLEAARAALRAVPTLELPANRRERIGAALADPDGARPARRRSPFRLAALLAPVAVLAALLVGVLAVSTGEDAGVGGDAALQAEERATEGAEEDPDAGAGDFEEAAPSAGGGEALGGTTHSAPQAAAGPVASVRGPAEAVASLLRERGFDARVDDGRVVVRNARPAAVVRALGREPRGPVTVSVE